MVVFLLIGVSSVFPIISYGSILMTDRHPRKSTEAPRPGGAGPLAGHAVSRIGFGAMQLERCADRQAASDLVRRAIELGIDHIDTAQFYGNGFANEVLRDTIRPDDGVVIVSKIGADPDPNGAAVPQSAQRPEELRASVEDNLRSLGVEQIPVVNLRRMDVGPSASVAADQSVDLEDQLEAMTAMRSEGKIGAIGVSSVTTEGLRRAVPAGIVCVQNAYSLVDRGDEDMLELCRREGIAWVPYFPLGGAFPGLPKVAEDPAVLAIAGSTGNTPSQIGLAWLLRHSPNTLLIPGTANVDHLEANVAAGSIVLDDEAQAALDAVPSRSLDTPIG